MSKYPAPTLRGTSTFNSTYYGTSTQYLEKSKNEVVTGKYTFNNNLTVTSGNSYQINNVDVLSSNTLGSGVINSSLTSVGTLSSLAVSGSLSANTISQSTPSILAYHLGTLSIANATTTTVVYDTQKISQGSTGLSYSSGTFTNTSGVTRCYIVVLTTSFGTNSTGYRYVYINKSTGVLPSNAYWQQTTNAATTGNSVNVTALMIVPNGESFYTSVYQNSGAALSSGAFMIQILAL